MDHSSRKTPNDSPTGLSRRELMGAALAGAVAACAQPEGGPVVGTASAQDVGALADEIERELETDNIYVRMLGLKPHLPAHGHATKLGGCRMPDEVVEAMQDANKYFVLMDELLVAAGKKAAEMVKAEDALITSGASGGLLLGTAACLTGTDEEKMKALPHPTWPKHECVIQKANRYMYDHALRAAGATLVEVEGRDQLVNAIGKNTAVLFGLPRHGAMRQTQGTEVVQPEELIEIGKKAGVPVLIDGASRLVTSRIKQINRQVILRMASNRRFARMGPAGWCSLPHCTRVHSSPVQESPLCLPLLLRDRASSLLASWPEPLLRQYLLDDVSGLDAG